MAYTEPTKLTVHDLERHYADVKKRLNASTELARLRRELEAKGLIIAGLQRNAAEASVTIECLNQDLRAANEKIAQARETIHQPGGDLSGIKVVPIKMISMKDIKAVVCRHYNLDMSELTSARRTQPLVTYRQIAMYLCKKLTRFSLPEIGRTFGGRDHSTVISAVRKIEGYEPDGTVGLLTTDPKIKNEIDVMRQCLEQKATPPEEGVGRASIATR